VTDRKERDEWKARTEAAERKLTNRAQCCVENEERLRVRDARVEPLPVEVVVLAWNDGCWSPAWLRMDRKTLVFCDPDFGAGPIEKAPYWIPMPPPPVRDPRREAADEAFDAADCRPNR
jgi:hypothetical protein